MMIKLEWRDGKPFIHSPECRHLHETESTVLPTYPKCASTPGTGIFSLVQVLEVDNITLMKYGLHLGERVQCQKKAIPFLKWKHYLRRTVSNRLCVP
jgi:hypothetical protein